MTDSNGPKTIVIGSRNEGKLCEIQAILAGLPVELKLLTAFENAPEVEETGKTFRENAELKALTLAGHVRAWVLADDSGLEVDALGGAPGIFSARYAGSHGDDAANNEKLLAELNGLPEARRTARFRCVMALAAPGRILAVVEGSCEGRIDTQTRGDEGFGYDPLFFYPPFKKTFGELEKSVKNSVSHRAGALNKLRAALPAILERSARPEQARE